MAQRVLQKHKLILEQVFFFFFLSVLLKLEVMTEWPLTTSQSAVRSRLNLYNSNMKMVWKLTLLGLRLAEYFTHDL